MAGRSRALFASRNATKRHDLAFFASHFRDRVHLLKKSTTRSPAYINETKTPTIFLSHKCPCPRGKIPCPGVSCATPAPHLRHHPLRQGCATPAQPLRNPCATPAQPLRNPCATPVPPLRNPCATPAPPLRLTLRLTLRHPGVFGADPPLLRISRTSNPPSLDSTM